MGGDHKKPEFENTINTGNLISLAGLAITGTLAIGSVWVSLSNQVSAAQANIQGLDNKIAETRTNIEKRQDRTEARIEKALEQVNHKLDRLIEQRAAN